MSKDSRKPKKSNYYYQLLLLLAFVLGLALRLQWLVDRPQVKPIITYDEHLFYTSTAANAYQGRGFFPDYNWVQDGIFVPAPMQALYIWGVFELVGGTALEWPRLLQALLSCGMIFLGGAIGCRLANRTMGIILGFGIALYPCFVFWPGYLFAESNFLCGLTVLTWLLLRWSDRPTLLGAIVISVLLGALNLQRVNALFLGLLLAPYAMMQMGRKRGWPSALTFIFVPLLTMSPWLIRNLIVYGEPILVSSNSGVNFYHSNNPNLDAKATPTWEQVAIIDAGSKLKVHAIEADLRDAHGKLRVTYHNYSARYMKAALTYMLHQPGHFLRNYFYKFIGQFTTAYKLSYMAMPRLRVGKLFQLLHWSLLSLGLSGIVWMALHWRSTNMQIILGMFAYFSLLGGFFLQTIDGRWALPHKLLLWIGTAYTLSKAYAALAKHTRQRI